MERRKQFWTEQRKREYIREAEDNLFIVAGPGTGKTTLLSKRILNQIMGGERLSHFLLLAFTDEAVAEFKQKIKKHLYREIAINKEMSHRLKRKVYGIDSMHITTFRDFCLYVIHVKEHFQKAWKREQYIGEVEKNACLQEIRKAVQKSTELKSTESEYSFMPLEEQCYRILKENPKLLQILRRDFTKIYADELQDLNQTQLDILLLLSTDKKGKMRHNCLFMVGDPIQTI